MLKNVQESSKVLKSAKESFKVLEGAQVKSLWSFKRFGDGLTDWQSNIPELVLKPLWGLKTYVDDCGPTNIV